MDRRTFIGGLAAAGAAWTLGCSAGPRKIPAGEKLKIAVVGVGNQGAWNLAQVAHENVVALCDVDAGFLGAAARRHPSAQTYRDFRVMLAESKDIDAVVCATPDHTHAVVAMAAMKLGKHVYCEKPLGHSVWEVRRMAETARRSGVATQMGTQIHAGGNYRRVVELVRSGAIGDIAEVHVWVGGAWSAGDLPKETPATPSHVDWELWLGPAASRPYHPEYHPANWRKWWNFGGGHLADMGCHHIDLPTWALELRHPVAIEAQGPPVHADGAPAWLVVTYDYPARGAKPPVRLTWYHGDKRPKHFAEGRLPTWGNGTLFVGSKGMLIADYDRHKLLPETAFKGFGRPPESVPPSIGHHKEWIAACKSGGPTTCNFDYSGALTEAVLLGNVAYRMGRRIEWDAANLRVANSEEADGLLRRDYREGWAW